LSPFAPQKRGAFFRGAKDDYPVGRTFPSLWEMGEEIEDFLALDAHRRVLETVISG
jgi:hypothetical protein